MEETAAPEPLNTRLLAKGGPVVALLLLPVSLDVMPVACAGVQRAEPSPDVCSWMQSYEQLQSDLCWLTPCSWHQPATP